MSKAEERTEFIKVEKLMIKNLLLSRINKDGKEDVHMRYLKETMEAHNKLIRDYFASKKNLNGPKEPNIDLFATEDTEELIKKLSKSKKDEDYFYVHFRDYLHLLMDKKDLEKKPNKAKKDEYQNKLFLFATQYEISKRLLEITEWYFANNEDNTHNVEQFADILTQDSDRLFVFRRELMGKTLELTPDETWLNDSMNRAKLIAIMKTNLLGEYTRGDIQMIKDLYDSNSKTEAASGIILYDVLNTAAYISVAKEHGYEESDLDIENMTENSKKAVRNFPRAVGYEDIMSELDCMEYTATIIARKFDNYKTARLS